MCPTIRAKCKNPINGVFKRANFASNIGFKLFFLIILNLMRIAFEINFHLYETIFWCYSLILFPILVRLFAERP